MTTPHRHREDDELLAYRLGFPGSDESVAADVANCAECARRMEENDRFLASIRDPETWRVATQDETVVPEAGLSRLRLELDQRAEHERAAAALMEELQRLQPAEWVATLRGGEPNEALTRRLVNASIAALDRSPAETIAILDAAEETTRDLSSGVAAEYRCEIWKNRANAYRMTGEYDAALTATARAAKYTRLWPTGTHALGQVIYTRGTVLFKMGRYTEASDCADAAIEYLRDFGDRQRIAYARNLNAAICTEEGRLKEAAAIYAELRPEMESLEDTFGVATMTANLATTNVRLGNLNTGRKYAIEALQRFIDLGSTADEVRMRWVLATIRAAEGDREGAIDRFRAVATGFESLGMHGDAARVKLDVAEQFLRNEEWEELEVVSREAAETFARNDARPHLVHALSYLRQAVEHRSVTAELLAYLRSYIELDKPEAGFDPPRATAPN
jgi:tetratricopeptide (TPR) repeat protein